MIVTKESRRELQKCYKFIYKCTKCHKQYGSDKEEIKKQLCPICDVSHKNSWGRWRQKKNKLKKQRIQKQRSKKGATFKLKQRFKYKAK